MIVQLDQVTKTYSTQAGPVHALHEASLQVEGGRFVAVQGPSGCGKSTLLMLAGGLTAPTSGTVTVAGKRFGEMSPAQRADFRARHIGFVFQMFHLLPYLKVVENVTAAALPGDANAAHERAVQLLERFQLKHRLGHRPADLSAGERQRVAIARAMINRPELVLADEPTGNLDPDSAAIVLKLLTDFQADGGTVLLATHDAAAVEYAEYVVQLRQGRVVSTGGEAVVPSVEG